MKRGKRKLKISGWKVIVVIIILLTVGISLIFAFASNNQNAEVVLGQSNFGTNTVNYGGVSASSLHGPIKVFSDGIRLYIADMYNHRVLIHNSIPTSNNEPADVVLGQPNFTSNTINNGGISAKSLYHPYSVFSDGTRLYIADIYNHRVLIHNSIPTSNNEPADVVLGQPNFTSNTANNGGISANSLNYPIDVFSDGTRLYITDQHNHRVLIYDHIPTNNNEPANVVLGQVDFYNNGINSGRGENSPVANSLYFPIGVYNDGTRLYIVDRCNHRVLIYNNILPNDNEEADVVLGQPDFEHNGINSGAGESNPVASSLYFPWYIYSDGIRLYIGDRYNHRVLIHNSIPTSNNEPADMVFGQPDFISNTANNGGVSASSLNYPIDVFSDGVKLFISDHCNHRVLIYNPDFIPLVNRIVADEDSTVIAADGKTKVEFLANALGQDGDLIINLDAEDNPQVADINEIKMANEKDDADENFNRIPGSITEFVIYNTEGELIEDNFGAPVIITLPYEDVNQDGWVGNMNPRLHENTLAIYELVDSQWSKLSGSTVDTVENTVSAEVSHFSVYALLGEPTSDDLKRVFAYPVPFKTNDHFNITFTNLTAYAKIKIYTISGEKVCELEETDGDGNYQWDGAKDLSSGVYIYTISNNQGDKKKGRLMIIR
jgi:hypothetical protein